jgi:hypothetical protein
VDSCGGHGVLSLDGPRETPVEMKWSARSDVVQAAHVGKGSARAAGKGSTPHQVQGMGFCGSETAGEGI